MSRPVDSLATLRDQAVAGVESLVDLIGLGVTLGAPVPPAHAVRRPFEQVGGCDIPVFLADSHRLAAAYGAVAEHLHHLPEQQVRLDQGWRSAAGTVMIAAVVDHQRRAEADLHILRQLSEATSAAASGIDGLLRTWYLTVARLSQPLIGGVPIPEVPAAILTGTVPVGIVIDDITSRCQMYLRSAHATVTGIDDILTTLNRATDDLDTEPYFAVPSAAVAEVPTTAIPTSDTAAAPDTTTNVDTEPAATEPHRDDVPLRLSSSADAAVPAGDGAAHPDLRAERTGLENAEAPRDQAPEHDRAGTGGDLALAGDQ